MGNIAIAVQKEKNEEERQNFEKPIYQSPPGLKSKQKKPKQINHK